MVEGLPNRSVAIRRVVAEVSGPDGTVLTMYQTTLPSTEKRINIIDVQVSFFRKGTSDTQV